MKTDIALRKEYMREALNEAEKAYEEGEVPVGCVIVRGGEVVARAHNSAEAEGNPLRHAELKAMAEALKSTGNRYLSDCEMYVTVEPCAMCAGGIVNARIGALYFGVREPKTGCCGSNYSLTEDSRFYHRVAPVGGILEEECELLMRKFFKDRREKC